MNQVFIVDGVRFRAEDAARLNLATGVQAKTNPSAPVTTTSAQYTAQQEAAAALTDETEDAAAQVIAAAQAQAAQIVADAQAAAAKIQEGAGDGGGDGGNISGDAGGSGDADKPASEQPKTGARAKTGK